MVVEKHILDISVGDRVSVNHPEYHFNIGSGKVKEIESSKDGTMLYATLSVIAAANGKHLRERNISQYQIDLTEVSLIREKIKYTIWW